MSKDTPSPSTSSSPSPPAKKPTAEIRRVYLVPYPNVIYLYPTMLVAVVAAIWLAIRGESDADPANPFHVGFATTFLCVMAINLIVLAFDFPRATSLTAFFFLATLALAFTVLFMVKPALLPPLQDALLKVRPAANATFYWFVVGILGVIFIFVKIKVQFDWWELRNNELLHHHGILSDLKRFPVLHLRLDKEITDVFEYALLRSGRLILQPSGEKRAIVLDNVPFINKKEKQMVKLLDAWGVDFTNVSKLADD